MARRSVPHKREALLKAAKAVFSRRGYHDTTVAAIAEEAGVATGSFYSYFSSKESCFLGLVDTLYERLMAGVLSARRQVSSTEEKLLVSVAAATSVFLEEPDLSRFVLSALHGGQPALETRIMAISRDLTDLLAADLLAAGGPAIRPGRAAVHARFLMGGLTRALSEHLSREREEDPLLLEEALLSLSRSVVASVERGPVALLEGAHDPEKGRKGRNENKDDIGPRQSG